MSDSLKKEIKYLSSKYSLYPFDLGEEHHSDLPVTMEDEEIGGLLSYRIGDTFIDWGADSPQRQWTIISRALRVHGLRIVGRND